MGISILDPHPSNECINLDSKDAWFSFIFCGSRIDKLKLHAYDYYTGEEIVSADTVYESIPATDPKLMVWNGVGNGVRVNIHDFVKDKSLFSADGEYTWRAELIQDIDFTNSNMSLRNYPDNMVFEGVLPGEPSLIATVDNVKGLDYSKYLPLTPNFSKKIRPPYYIDFLDSKYESTVYDVPVTYDRIQTKSDGTQDTIVQVDTYTSTTNNTKAVPRPAVGSEVYIHKKPSYGAVTVNKYQNSNQFYIDDNIPSLNTSDDSNAVFEGCYLKVANEYYLIKAYDKTTGLVECQDGYKLKAYPAGTHYAIYTSRFWTPYYYFRVHSMPTLILDAEFHENRRLKNEWYDDSVNCLENTFNGILFKGCLLGDSHAAVNYHYWEIIDAGTGKTIFKTEKTYSQEMDCEVFVPFGRTYIGKLTVVTQDNITIRDEISYTMPSAPVENNERFKLRAIQNKFGGVELAWQYNYYYDGSSFLKATQFEVWRLEKKINKLKYLGKVDFSPVGIEGVTPAYSGGNWYLIDKSCDFKLKTPQGAKVNMYLVGGGSDGGSWDVTPNSLNNSFAVAQSGGQGGCFIKQSITSSDGLLECHAKVAERNDNNGTTLLIDGNLYRCNDSGYSQRGSVKGNTMTQTTGYSVVYNNDAEDGIDGFDTPYGYVASSGGGGAACGGNKTSGGVKSLSVSGITPKYSKGNWVLIDRESLGGATGNFTLNVPDGAKVNMYLVGGGSDGTKYVSDSSAADDYNWDNNGVIVTRGYGGGCVLQKELSLSGDVTCDVVVADANDMNGTKITINGSQYKCNDSGHIQRKEGSYAIARHPRNGNDLYKPATAGQNGISTPYGYVGSSGGGGGTDNKKDEAYRMGCWNGASGGKGAGNGGYVTSTNVVSGTDAVNYGCGGGGASIKELDYYNGGSQLVSNPGKGMPGCIIFELVFVDVPCPDAGVGGIGAGDGGFPNDNGENAVRYGCGGGGAGFYAIDSDGNYKIGNVGRGMQGCIILEVLLDGIDGSIAPEQVYAVDWTAASDKEYQYIVAGCNCESAYKTTRHLPEEMIECMGTVDITPHFEDFYIYFLNDADVLVDTEFDYENYETPLIEPMGRYVTSRNNPYEFVKRHMHTLALNRKEKAFYRRHTWRIEGDVAIDETTHNITRNVNNMYAKMPSIVSEPTGYDSFSMSFLFGYLDCEQDENAGFVFDSQYMFELWKKCVENKPTVMIKDPKGNIWTGSITAHTYQVEYDTDGMPYIINIEFTQDRTERNTLVMIVDSHNQYLKTAKKNHLK